MSDFPVVLTAAVDGAPGVGTPILAKHLNNLEAKVGIDGSAVTTSLDYLLKNIASIEPGHRHTKLWDTSGAEIALDTDASGNISTEPFLLGSELCPALTTPNWTLQSGWQYLTSPNRIDKNGAGDGESVATPATPLTIVVGTLYKVVFTVSAITPGAGGVYLILGGIYRNFTVTGTYTWYMMAATTDNLMLYGDIDTTVTFTAISVKEVTAGGNLTVINKLKLAGNIIADDGNTLLMMNNGVADFGTQQIAGGPYSATQKNLLSLSSYGPSPEVRFTMANNSLVSFTQFQVLNADDIVLWMVAKSTSGYGGFITYNCAGCILSTYDATPVVLAPYRTVQMTIKSNGIVNIVTTPTYADNAAAIAGGLDAGDVYRTSTGVLMVRY